MKNPNLIPRPFAQNGQKDDIPANYKSDLPSQKATWDTGFPQITMMPVTAGGLPPSGRDFNGIFNQISDNIVHLSKGGKYKFSLEYANSIGGYSRGAILQSDDETKEFQSLIDNNKINFNTASADKINSAWKLVNTNQILDELNKKFDKSDVVQSVGGSQTQVMSQKSVTDVLNDVRTLANTANQNAANANANANNRLEKSQNGADIPNKPEFVKNLGLAAGSALPVGVPIPWPLATPPDGWLRCDGSIFGAAQYPELAKVYPSLRLPDLRGEFIRGWDDSGKVDVGRRLLSSQNFAFQDHYHALPTSTGVDWDKSEQGITTVFSDAKAQNFAWDTSQSGGNNTGLWSGNLFRTYRSSVDGGVSVANETRPRNIAFNYIVRAV